MLQGEVVPRIWQLFQKAQISRFNPLSNRPVPDPDHPGPYILELAILPETSHLAIQSFVKLTIYFLELAILPETVHHAINSFIQNNQILAQTIEDHISWDWPSLRKP